MVASEDFTVDDSLVEINTDEELEETLVEDEVFSATKYCGIEGLAKVSIPDCSTSVFLLV